MLMRGMAVRVDSGSLGHGSGCRRNRWCRMSGCGGCCRGGRTCLYRLHHARNGSTSGGKREFRCGHGLNGGVRHGRAGRAEGGGEGRCAIFTHAGCPAKDGVSSNPGRITEQTPRSVVRLAFVSQCHQPRLIAATEPSRVLFPAPRPFRVQPNSKVVKNDLRPCLQHLLPAMRINGLPCAGLAVCSKHD